MEKSASKSAYLIRHAYSTFNYKKDCCKADSSIPYDKFSSDFIDSPLHEKGIAQCHEASSKLAALNFHHIFVSPFQRTLETSYELFRSHPNIGSIKFIVHPLLTEILNNANDIPLNTLSRLRPHYEKQPNFLYDFSEFDKLAQPELFYLEYLNSPEKELLLSKITKDAEGKYNDVPIVLEAMRANPKKKLEKEENVAKRVNLFKNYLLQYAKDSVKPGEEIGIVTNTEFILQAMAGFKGILENCTIMKWNI